MQKFTRALTREIEVEGVRLAVTLDAAGVTLRPVGSRRPPLRLDWPGVLCACAGSARLAPPTPREIAAALELLRRGAGSAAGTVADWLERLDAWMARHRPRYHAGLEPGAEPTAIAALGQALGQPVPDELRQWLRWHDGQKEDLIGSFWEAFNLMSAAQIAAAWQDRAANPEPGWDPGWIPLLDDYQGDLVVLDPGCPGCAVREVWRGREDHPVVAASLAAWLESFVTEVEAGRYEEDPERGEFHRI